MIFSSFGHILYTEDSTSYVDLNIQEGTSEQAG